MTGMDDNQTDDSRESARMLRPEELDIKLHPQMAEELDAYIDAIERDDWEWDSYCENMLCIARDLPEEWYDWVVWYYVEGGWKQGDGRETQPSRRY